MSLKTNFRPDLKSLLPINESGLKEGHGTEALGRSQGMQIGM